MYGIRQGRALALFAVIGAVVVEEKAGAQTTATQYTIQLGAFPSESAASAFSNQVNTLQTPVFVRSVSGQTENSYKVCLGQYPTYMDAWVVKSALPASHSAGFITKIDEQSTQSEISTYLGTIGDPVPAAELFEPLPAAALVTSATNPVEFVSIAVPEESVVLTPELVEKPTDEMNRTELLGVGIKTKQNDKGTSALGHFLGEYTQDSARKAAKLRLARRLMQKKDFQGAKAELTQLEAQGTAAEKRKARVVKAYIEGAEKGRGAAFEAFKGLANDTALPADLRSHAMRQAAQNALAARNYTSGVLALNQIIREAPSLQERLDARLERCGAMFEMVTRGKAKWPEVIAECSALKSEAGAPDVVRAGAALMEFEARRFQEDFGESYALGKAFLEQWGENPKAYESNTMRRYVNTARLFQMQNAYVTGNASEALTMAQNVVNDPPEQDEHFAHGNTFLYACVIGNLSGSEAQAEEFETRGREFNDAYFTMLRQSIEELKTKFTSN